MAVRQIIQLLGLTFLLYFSGIHFKISGIVVRPADFLLLFILGLVVHVWLSSGDFLHARIKGSRIITLLLVFVLYSFLNGLFQGVARVAFKELTQALMLVSFTYLIAAMCTTYEKRELFIDTIRVMFVATSLLLFAYFSTSGLSTGFKTFGPFKHIYALAGLLALHRFLTRPSKVYLLLLMAMITIMLFSGEKKGWIAFLAAAIYLVPRYGRISGYTFKPLLVASTLVLFVSTTIIVLNYRPAEYYVQKQLKSLTGVGNLVAERLLVPGGGSEIESWDSSVFTRSNYSRFRILKLSLAQIEDTPIFGTGPGALKKLASQNSRYQWVDHGTHNHYLQTLVEYGIIGLVLLLFLIFSLFRYSNYLIGSCHNKAEIKQIMFIKAFLIFGTCINGLFGGSDALNLLYILVPTGFLFSLKFSTHDTPREVEVVHS